MFVAGQNIEGQAGIASGYEQIFSFVPFSSEAIEASKITQIYSNRSQTFVSTQLEQMILVNWGALERDHYFLNSIPWRHLGAQMLPSATGSSY